MVDDNAETKIRTSLSDWAEGGGTYVERLTGACVLATDVRAAMALVPVALSASRKAVLGGLDHLDRSNDRQN
jgi:UDP-N-acetylglucosamine enolpyruvyl transferase